MIEDYDPIQESFYMQLYYATAVNDLDAMKYHIQKIDNLNLDYDLDNVPGNLLGIAAYNRHSEAIALLLEAAQSSGTFYHEDTETDSPLWDWPHFLDRKTILLLLKYDCRIDDLLQGYARVSDYETVSFILDHYTLSQDDLDYSLRVSIRSLEILHRSHKDYFQVYFPDVGFTEPSDVLFHHDRLIRTVRLLLEAGATFSVRYDNYQPWFAQNESAFDLALSVGSLDLIRLMLPYVDIETHSHLVLKMSCYDLDESYLISVIGLLVSHGCPLPDKECFEHYFSGSAYGGVRSFVLTLY